LTGPISPRLQKTGLAVAGAVLILTALAELAIHRHGYLGFDEIFAFHGWFGLIAGGVAVVGARAIALALGRPEETEAEDD